MSDDRDLQPYREKRDFGATPEPSGEESTGAELEVPIFVIQKHNASHLHYDFRLEINGVLKSWSVPKGPSLNPKDKRLAVPTEDHPMSYARFEGVIPKGNYGAGEVIVWDTGTYRNTTERNGEPISVDRAAERGHITFELNGEKLRGGYALTRFRSGDEEAWLLVKKDDEYANPECNITEEKPASAISGRTIEDLRSSR